MRVLKFFLLAVWVPFQVAAADLPKAAVVNSSQFKKGTSWSWTYFNEDAPSGEWKPYLVETYVLTDVQGKNLTFEMHSSPYPMKETPAHHKFIVDFTKCEQAAAGGPRAWTMRFYTHSFGPKWELVSNDYENTAFTEKFNCIIPSQKESITYARFEWKGATVETFSPPQLSHGGDSFYFLRPPFAGIAAQKTFSPAKNYKFEFSGKTS